MSHTNIHEHRSDTSGAKQATEALRLVANRDGWQQVDVNGDTQAIPKSWRALKLSNCATLHRGGNINKEQAKELSGTPCVLYGQLFTTYGATIKSVKSRTAVNSVVTGQRGDVLMPSSTTTTGADLATASALLMDGVAIGGDINIIRPDQNRVDPEWLARKMTSLRPLFGRIATGLTVFHVYNKNISTADLGLPPLKEQTRIASVLSTQEAQIEDLRALRDAEKQRLSWLTEELLSGRVRVKEKKDGAPVVVTRDGEGEPAEILGAFELVPNADGWQHVEANGVIQDIPNDWENLRLSSCASLHRGGNINKDQAKETDGAACVLYGQLFTTYGRTIKSVKSRTSVPTVVTGQRGDVLMPSSTTTTGADLATASALLLDGVAIGGDINIIRPDQNRVDPEWLARKMTSLRSLFGRIATGLTVFHVYNKNISVTDLCLPPLKEQQRISAVLSAQERQISDLDDLIEVERKRLAWLTEELLSGRVRVEENAGIQHEEAAA